MYRVLEYTLLFIVVVILQVFLFNNLQIGFYLNPFIYLAFIILLPTKVKDYILLLLALALGVLMDMSMGTPAINTISTIFMAFCRPVVLRLFMVKDDIEDGGVPNINNLGIWKFINYSLALIIIHNITFFALETMTLSGIIHTVIRIVISVISTLITVYLCQLLFIVNRSKI